MHTMASFVSLVLNFIGIIIDFQYLLNAASFRHDMVAHVYRNVTTKLY